MKYTVLISALILAPAVFGQDPAPKDPPNSDAGLSDYACPFQIQ